MKALLARFCGDCVDGVLQNRIHVARGACRHAGTIHPFAGGLARRV